MASTPSVIGTTSVYTELYDYDDYLLVTNGQFWIEFYKETYGYNVVRNLDDIVLVYNDRVIVEYFADPKWKPRGVPVSLSYVVDGEGYTITRHYTDYIDTTYDIDYTIQPDLPIKITVRLHSGQSDAYRIIWSLSGITESVYQEGNTSLDFDTITFDWEDAYISWGNITTTEVTDTAQGKKADIIFDVGYVEADSDIVLDPSIIGTSTNNGIRTYQKLAYYAGGRHWVFYFDGANSIFKSSLDGESWSAATIIGDGAAGTGYPCEVYFDGTYVHYVRIDDITDDMYYRRGVPESDGTITWSAVEQEVKTGTFSRVHITVDTSGHPFIMYYADSCANVINSSETDGTWTTDTDQLFNADGDNIGIGLVEIDNDDVYAVYRVNASKLLRGVLWDGSWNAPEAVSTSQSASYYRASLVGWGTSVTVAFADTGYIVTIIDYEEGSWGAEVELYDGTTLSPSISKMDDSGDVVVFWQENPSGDHIYYQMRREGVWDEARTDWITDAGIPNAYTGAAGDGNEGISPYVYLGSAASPYDVTYAFLLNILPPTVTNSAADNITIAGADLHGNITATGGVNATNRGFEWDIDSGAPYAESWDEAGDFGVGAFENTFIDMPPNTTIYWRSYAINSEGTSYSDELSFNTLLPLPLAPTNFIVERSGLNTVTLSWTKGTYANTTVIRVKADEAPIDITDGFYVYTGNGTSGNTTGINSGEFNVYGFSAWSYNETGYSEEYTTYILGGEAMEAIGDNMILFTLMLFAMIGTGYTYVFRKQQIAFLAALAWTLLAFFSLSLSSGSNPTQITDIYMALFWGSVAMVIISAFEPMIMKPPSDEVDDPATKETETYKIENEYDDLQKEMLLPRVRRKKLVRREPRDRG